MKQHLPGMPGKLAHTFSCLLTLLLTACVALACVTFTASRLLTDRGMHTSIALNDTVLDAQMARITAQVEKLADTYHFAPETAMAFVTRESVMAYNEAAVDWWMGLTQAEPTYAAPKWSADGLDAAILSDELFTANTAAGQKKSIARDKCAAGVVSAVTESVLPIRTVLLTLAMPQVEKRVDVPRYVGYLNKAPLVLTLATLLLCGLLALVMHRRVFRCLTYVGAGLSAGALVTAGVMVLAAVVNLPGMVGQISPLLAMQASLLMSRLAWLTAIPACVCLVVGLVLMGLHQRKMLALRRGLAGAEVAA